MKAHLTAPHSLLPQHSPRYRLQVPGRPQPQRLRPRRRLPLQHRVDQSAGGATTLEDGDAIAVQVANDELCMSR